MKAFLSAMWILLIAVVMTGCEDDVDFDANNRTVDVELDNAELVALGVIQATLIPHIYLPTYDFLDASDLPLAGQPSGYQHGCVNAPIPEENKFALATYTYTRDAGQEHRSGDRVSVDYSYCDLGDGYLRNGRISIRYVAINGLNSTFQQSDTETCLAALSSDYPGALSFEYTSDAVRLRNVAETVVIEAINLVEQETEPGEDTPPPVYEVVDSDVVSRFARAIVTRHVRPENEPENAVTSVSGDQIYLLQNREYERVACQQYERILSAAINDLNVMVDDMSITLNGTVTLSEGSSNLVDYTNAIRDSDFTVSLRQGNLQEVFTLRGFSLSEAYSLTQGSYTMNMSGEISSPAIGGTGFINTNSTLSGLYANGLPTAGIFTLLGRDLEQIAIIASEDQVRLNIDLNGDSDGNARPDTDEVLFTTWNDLLNRDFQQVP